LGIDEVLDANSTSDLLPEGTMREQPKQQMTERRLTKRIRFEMDTQELTDPVKGTRRN
jgi:hypothetical protein